jgi:hypothetical protein
MEKNFKIKPEYRNVVHTIFLKEGGTDRFYGHNMTQEFALELVKLGRKEIFETLPKAIKVVTKEEK